MRLYPVTIIATRYGGSYEGGAWAAFHCNEDELPPAATGDDTSCAVFWSDVSAHMAVGVGATPNDALTALEKKIADLKARWTP